MSSQQPACVYSVSGQGKLEFRIEGLGLQGKPLEFISFLGKARLSLFSFWAGQACVYYI